jgi:hypothetical protein
VVSGCALPELVGVVDPSTRLAALVPAITEAAIHPPTPTPRPGPSACSRANRHQGRQLCSRCSAARASALRSSGPVTPARPINSRTSRRVHRAKPTQSCRGSWRTTSVKSRWSCGQRAWAGARRPDGPCGPAAHPRGISPASPRPPPGSFPTPRLPRRDSRPARSGRPGWGFRSSGRDRRGGQERPTCRPTCQPSGADGGPTTHAPLSDPRPRAAAATPRTTRRAPPPGRPAARRARPASPPQSPRGSP